ncbi:hypothetical protein CWC26_06870 [Pseudoalteromonas sp. S4488]|nr:hypothetical protein CWC26_06870 [Pseudoalteromonas sp. S4488]
MGEIAGLFRPVFSIMDNRKVQSEYSCCLKYKLLQTTTRVYIDGYNFYYGCLKCTNFKWL